MAHELTFTKGQAEMAYVGETPWHGFGQKLEENASPETWRTSAGLNWEVKRTPVLYRHTMSNDDSQIILPEPLVDKKNHVLYRSDTHAQLSIVSDRYQLVQPFEVLDFFNSLVKSQGFTIETAGTLKGGRRIWALARTGFDGEVVANDVVKTYLLLVTSFDGGLATTAMFTSIRVVCNNTLQMSLSGNNAGSQVKVRHNTSFDAQLVKTQLGLDVNSVYTEFMTKMQGLANKDISGRQAEEILTALFSSAIGDPRQTKGYKSVLQLFNGAGKGSRIEGVAGTGWGLVNAVTEYTDYHVRSRNAENRMDRAWFGAGAASKKLVIDLIGNF